MAKMGTEQELFVQVEEAVRTVLNTEEGEIKMESMFRADLGAESIDMLDISYEIEKLTGVELDFQEVLDFMNEKKGKEVTDISVDDLVDYIKQVKNGKG
jgi:acyl carrier protein